jgi:hypothetical protein
MRKKQLRRDRAAALRQLGRTEAVVGQLVMEVTHLRTSVEGVVKTASAEVAQAKAEREAANAQLAALVKRHGAQAELLAHAAAEADRLGDRVAILEGEVDEWRDAYAWVLRRYLEIVDDQKETSPF